MKPRGIRPPSPNGKRHKSTFAWQIVGRVRDKAGRSTPIYSPFVEALERGHKETWIRMRFKTILRSVGGIATDGSVNRYLAATRQYVRRRRGR